MKFQPDRVRIQMNMEFKIFWTHPIGLKFVLKVFGRGGGGEPFLRKVSPDKYVYIPVQSFLYRRRGCLRQDFDIL